MTTTSTRKKEKEKSRSSQRKSSRRSNRERRNNNGTECLIAITAVALVLFLLGQVVHAADISNCTKPPNLQFEWTKRVMTEFFMQGDLEASIGGNGDDMGMGFGMGMGWGWGWLWGILILIGIGLREDECNLICIGHFIYPCIVFH